MQSSKENLRDRNGAAQENTNSQAYLCPVSQRRIRVSDEAKVSLKVMELCQDGDDGPHIQLGLFSGGVPCLMMERRPYLKCPGKLALLLVLWTSLRIPNLYEHQPGGT